MTKRAKVTWVTSFVAIAVIVTGLISTSDGSGDVVLSEFAQSVDLSPLAVVAVQHNGRLKSFDSYARSMMKWISGPRSINGQSAAFSYLDLMLRPEAYQSADIIYVKHKDVRRRITQRLAGDPRIPAARLTTIQDTGLIAPDLLARGEVQGLLGEMEQDLIRTNKAVNAIQDALTVSHPSTLFGSLRIVPPPGDDRDQSWGTLDTLVHDHQADGSVESDRPESQQVLAAWNQLMVGWSNQDPDSVNAAVAHLSGYLPQLNSALYPPKDKLQWESWYFRYKAMVWTWMVYLLAIVPLLMAVVYHWTGARRVGLALFVVAFALHTASLAIRWYLSGRIPNSNIYEAIMAATWFGGAAALVIEVLVRKTAVKNLFALGAAVCAMVAMMCSYFMPVQISADIDHVMPVLNDVWLYIHTNVIIFSYVLIAMAAVSAILYLIYRAGGGDRDHARAGGAGALILAGAQGGHFIKGKTVTMGQVLDAATMILMELAFVLLWAGIVMGAIWADHSWGRPWGWDPKEVFALNTFIIFLVLVHVRFKVKDKALWTAVLACVGCGVMLFNWIVVNFVITGMHSYA